MTEELTDKPEEATQEQDQTPEAAPEIQGVLVIRDEGPEGIRTDVRMLGQVKATEVQTLLELGLIGWREKLGLRN